MATKKIHQIPETVREDLIALAILQRGLRKTVVAVERRGNRIIEKLTGVKIDNEFLAGLLEQHNLKAAKLRAAKGVRA